MHVGFPSLAALAIQNLITGAKEFLSRQEVLQFSEKLNLIFLPPAKSPHLSALPMPILISLLASLCCLQEN